MQRIPEAELMEDEAQVRAYAEADFEAPHSRFIELLVERFGSNLTGYALDLGCGPGDITRRFANQYPACIVHAVDGSRLMLDYGLKQLPSTLENRVTFLHGRLPEATLPRDRYDIIISNSLLHHLAEPSVLWRSIRRFGAPGAKVFIMDLKRPAAIDEAKKLVETYAAEEPAILRRDFYHSLLAAFEPGEIKRQLDEAELAHLTLEEIGDRHLIVYGLL